MTTEALEPLTKSPALPESVIRRGISESHWRMLFNLYPGAKPDSALMVWDYCSARRLDPMKKPCHIVPMDYKDADGNWKKRDVVMPGIYEYRITAHRTNTYLGHSKPAYGPSAEIAGVDAPEWCEMTFFRWHSDAQRVIEFPVQVFFSEVVATNRDGKANTRWTKAPRQMLTKCTEAAGLREGWPEEFGGEPTFEEMDGRQVDADPVVSSDQLPQPGQRKSQQNGADESQQREARSRETPSAATGPVGGTPAPASPAATPSTPPVAVSPTAPAGGVQNVGTIETVDETPRGTLIVLNTGFRCATSNPGFIASAKGLKESGAIVELGTRAAKTAGNAPILEEILPVGGAE